MCMYAWSEGKPYIACHMDLVAINGLANDMSGEAD